MKLTLRAGLLSLAMFSAALPAAAQSNGMTTSSSSVTAGSTAMNVFNSPATTRNKSTIDTTANAFAPGLTSAGLNSCAGSSSVGVGGTGFSFGGGSTWEMHECTIRANAAALAGLGQNAAALEMLCTSDAMKGALNRSGIVCADQRAEYEAARQAARQGSLGVAPDENEPIVDTAPPRGRTRVRRQRVASRVAVRASIDQSLSNSGR
ncbi:hypothetical protein [Methylobacterium sp. E-066]|uniref:hypothetical protein n=1 Tax=Methylobacterium sp. E-066 TaxID=2836584 RepID=UPI001FB9952E|nr:hypothetical protein [Methylobacterium sp. E-066]MCJ2140442.1 hypothetical protein [Methylobacterium sp. E-066]